MSNTRIYSTMCEKKLGTEQHHVRNTASRFRKALELFKLTNMRNYLRLCPKDQNSSSQNKYLDPLRMEDVAFDSKPGSSSTMDHH